MVRLLVCLVICFAAAAVGGQFTSTSVRDWYTSLRQPPITPPSWTFGVVWTILYAMMAIAWWRAWRVVAGTPGGWKVHLAFGVQLALNVLWSAIFFGLQQPTWALVEIVILLVAIAVTVRVFAAHDRPAAWLMLPYLLWVAFATVLNGWFVALN